MRKPLFLALAVLVAGCDDGKYLVQKPLGEAHQAKARSANCKPVHVKVQLFGDSTMWGYDGSQGNGGRAPSYPESALRAALDMQFGTGKVSVETRAVSGTTSTQLLEGKDGVNKPWPLSVDAHLVVINHGINDRAAKMTPEAYKANLRRLAKLAAPARVVFQTPLPVWSERYLPAYLDQSFAPEMRAVAAELGAPVIDANAVANSIPSWNSKDYAPDSLHPNSKGYRTIATQAQVPALLPIIQDLRCPQQ